MEIAEKTDLLRTVMNNVFSCNVILYKYLILGTGYYYSS